MNYKGTKINNFLLGFLITFITFLFTHFSVYLLIYTVLIGLIIIAEWKKKHQSKAADETYKKITDRLDEPEQTVGKSADIIGDSNGEIDYYLSLEKSSIVWVIVESALWCVYFVVLTISVTSSAVESGSWINWVFAGLLVLVSIGYFFLSVNNGSKNLSLFEAKKHKLLALANFVITMKNHPFFDPDLPIIEVEENKAMFNNFPEDQAKTMQARHEFSMKYAEEQGWKGELSIDQILEIRNQEGWKKPVVN